MSSWVKICARSSKPNDHAFAVQRRHRGDTQVDVLAGKPDLDAAVLRQAALGDIELGENL